MAQYIKVVLFSLILAIVTIQLIRKHKLREEFALGWLGASITILLLSLLGSLLALLSPSFAVSYPPTLFLVLGFLSALLILLHQSVVLSTQANHIRDLAQSMAILEWRLHQYEKEQRTAVPPQIPTVVEENLYDPTNENSHHWPGRGHLRPHQTLGD
jgi:hypothetical protein